ncbi:MAG: lysophospholipase [Ruminococcaceae bacterium]|nr:lysophospholipase [Oscillospiraceae bacterium]
MKKVVFLGDSITDGVRCRDSEHFMGCGYPTLVSAELGFLYPNQYKFYNRGDSGSDVLDVYKRIREYVINIKPDIVSVLVGVNDVLHEYKSQTGISAEKYYKIYSMLIEEIKEALPETKIIILEPFVLRGSYSEEHYDDCRFEVEKRAMTARKIAEENNLIFVPLQEKFDKATDIAPNEYWLFDGVHPTAAGHELIKREWIKVFRTI